MITHAQLNINRRDLINSAESVQSINKVFQHHMLDAIRGTQIDSSVICSARNLCKPLRSWQINHLGYVQHVVELTRLKCASSEHLWWDYIWIRSEIRQTKCSCLVGGQKPNPNFPMVHIFQTSLSKH